MHDGVLGPRAADEIRERGLTVGALEMAAGWAAGDEHAIDRELAAMAPIAEAFSPEVMVAVVLHPTIDDHRAAAAGLARVGEWASALGMQVALEFLPWTAVASIGDAQRLLDAADHPACGLLLDTWHWARQPTGSDLGQLDPIDLRRVVYVQLDDAPADPVIDVLFDETLRHRLVPGEGAVDLVGLLSAVLASGADPYIAPEVFNRDMIAAGPASMAERIAAGTREVLAAAGWDPA